jgi:hypothetical protein
MSSLPALVRGLALGQAGPAPPVIIIELRQLDTVLKVSFNVDPASGIATGVVSGQMVPIEAFHVAIEPALQDPSTVYIVDPTSVGGSRVGSPADVIARTVVIAPPNSDHYKDFEKRRPRPPSPLSLHLEHWTLEELLAARPYISPNVTEREVVERWLQQGGQPQGCASYGRQLHEGSEQDGDVAWGNATGHPEGVYLKSSWTVRVYLLSGWTHWHWQLDERRTARTPTAPW